MVMCRHLSHPSSEKTDTQNGTLMSNGSGAGNRMQDQSGCSSNSWPSQLSNTKSMPEASLCTSAAACHYADWSTKLPSRAAQICSGSQGTLATQCNICFATEVSRLSTF